MSAKFYGFNPDLCEATEGDIGSLVVVLENLASCLRDNKPIARSHAHFLADALTEVTASLKKEPHLWPEARLLGDTTIRKRTKDVKRFEGKSGRIFNRAFCITRKSGRPKRRQASEHFRFSAAYMPLRSYGYTRGEALDRISNARNVSIEALVDYFDTKRFEPDEFFKAKTRATLARLTTKYLKHGQKMPIALAKAAELAMIDAKVVERTLKDFRHYVLVTLIRRRSNGEAVSKLLCDDIARDTGLPARAVLAADRKRRAHESQVSLAKAVISLQKQNLSLEAAIDEVSQNHSQSITQVQKALTYYRSRRRKAHDAWQKLFANRQNLERLVRVR